ncbi:hypothetical protein DEO72_LG10g3950 [Vigna unguiculata]|uniref:Rapid ALkalinization Factor n=1 Tax=Vigna unguiculata TaxID=3917 RepID=A0A4D6NIA7_VIGUN|nr:hypothetical protein DEO72_LG10g3950 [Vigna unguiculata]
MKRTHVSGVMWLVIILVNAYLGISETAKTNDTTSVCDGSLQECLNAGHLDSEFPTIAASHLARMLGEIKSKTLITTNRASSCPIRNDRYRDCISDEKKIPKERCSDPFKRSC